MQSGIIIAGLDGVEDSLLNNIGSTVEAIFAESGAGIDADKQRECINIMAQVSTFQRVGVAGIHDTEAHPDFHPNLDGYDETMNRVEAVDFIWQTDASQATEVFEHLLHTIHAIGLKQTFPSEWNYDDENSALRLAMQEAIDGGYYNVSSYEFILDPSNTDLEKQSVYNRITTQEFAYWMTAAAWDYYPSLGLNAQEISEEWSGGTTPQELQSNLPLADALYRSTIETVMTAPDKELFSTLF